MIKANEWRTEIKQADVARAVGLNSGHLSQLLSGIRPIGIPTAKKIAAFYKDEIPGLTFGRVIEMTPAELRKLFGMPPLKRKKKK